MTGRPDDREHASGHAGEWVLGTMSPGEATAFEASAVADPTLRAEVYAWQDRLVPLTRHAAAQDPSPALWPRIERAIAAPATTDRAWWRRPRPWQAIDGLALAASVALLATAGWIAHRTPAEPRGDHFLAVLQSPTDHANGWVVDVRIGGRLRLVPVASGAQPPPGRALQFWTKPQGAAGPTSLGLVQAGQSVEMAAPRLPGQGEQQLFEITLEPEQGSPLGRPTGPILFVGRSVPL